MNFVGTKGEALACYRCSILCEASLPPHHRVARSIKSTFSTLGLTRKSRVGALRPGNFQYPFGKPPRLLPSKSFQLYFFSTQRILLNAFLLSPFLLPLPFRLPFVEASSSNFIITEAELPASWINTDLRYGTLFENFQNSLILESCVWPLLFIYYEFLFTFPVQAIA